MPSSWLGGNFRFPGKGKRILLLLAPAILLAGLTMTTWSAPRGDDEIVLPNISQYMQAQQVVRKDYRFMPGGRLAIDTGFMGTVTIEGWDKPRVAVTATITGWGPTHDILMANMQKIAPRLRRSETRIDIVTEHDKSFQMGKIDYHLKVPRYRTDIKIRSLRGFIAIKDVNGWIEADTRVGYLALVDLSGYVSAKTERGDIMVQLKGHRWEGLQISAVTGTGDVKLFMPVDYNTDLTLITRKGKIDTDYPPFQIDEETFRIVPQVKKEGAFISQRIRRGGPTVVLQTDDGNVRFSKYDPDLETLEPSQTKQGDAHQ